VSRNDRPTTVPATSMPLAGPHRTAFVLALREYEKKPVFKEPVSDVFEASTATDIKTNLIILISGSSSHVQLRIMGRPCAATMHVSNQ